MLLNFVKPLEKERTTRSKYQFLPPKRNYTLFEASPVYRLVKCWNELPLKIKENEIFHDFKYDTTQFLINTSRRFKKQISKARSFASKFEITKTIYLSRGLRPYAPYFAFRSLTSIHFSHVSKS